MIPSTFYEKIVDLMPIASVEAMITRNQSLLFLKRKNNPAKGEWWFPGGRIRKRETFKETLLREVGEETGLNVEIVKLVGAYNRIFPERHDVTVVFLCKCLGNAVTLSGEHSEYKFFKKTPRNVNPLLLRVIRDSGWNF